MKAVAAIAGATDEVVEKKSRSSGRGEHSLSVGWQLTLKLNQTVDYFRISFNIK